MTSTNPEIAPKDGHLPSPVPETVPVPEATSLQHPGSEDLPFTADVLAPFPTPETPAHLRTTKTLNPLFLRVLSFLSSAIHSHDFSITPTLHASTPLFPPATLLHLPTQPLTTSELSTISNATKKMLEEKGWKDVFIEVRKHEGFSFVDRGPAGNVLLVEARVGVPDEWVCGAETVFDGQFRDGARWKGCEEEEDDEEEEEEEDGELDEFRNGYEGDESSESEMSG
ncbi:hypothetical protein HK097_000850 [Rhizophlyctis rosea]|uniref:Uncharacterized protein n=1 Tax=Rhizophlyctis rosea TaxID=64517 RepID=A0AAD5S7C7_9FUNG|nr:hypothetical protein HK097_000850 [Rhizophlyctis rosea]